MIVRREPAARMRVIVALIALVAGCARASTAQSTSSDHARVSLNVGTQPTSSTFAATTNNPIYAQTSTLTTSYSVPNGPFVDGGVTLKVSGGFGVDVAASWFSKSETAPISGTIPNPSFTRPRPISGTSSPLQRTEITGSIDAAYVVSRDRVDVALSAGPAFFTVNQDLVSDVTFNESPSFNAVTFTGAVVTKASNTALGFNGAVDVGIRLSKNIGIGGLIRYSRATMTLPLANTASGVSATVGGAHIGGGLRVYF